MRRPFGLAFTALDAPAIVARVLADAPEGPALVVTPNVDHIRLLRDPEFAAACQGAAMVCADGGPVAAYARLRGAKIAGRVTGCAIARGLMRDPALAGRRVCYVVESAATAAALANWAAREAPELTTILEAPAGLLRDGDAALLLAARIAAAAPRILVLTLGAPTSEIFAARHRAVLPACWVLCVGQAVRVELGLALRGPAWLGRVGLEWAWRAWREPARLGPRYALAALWWPVAIWRDCTGTGRVARRDAG